MMKQDRVEVYLADGGESVLAGYLLLLASQRQQREMAAALKPLGVTPVHCQILYGIYELSCRHEIVAQNDLIRHIDLNKAMISTVLKKLVEKGYVLRQDDSKDSRAKNLFLTEDGTEIVLKAFPLVQSVSARMFDTSDIDLGQFISALSRLIDRPVRDVGCGKS